MNIFVIPLTAIKVSTFNTLATNLPTTRINFCNIPKWNNNPIIELINTIGNKAFKKNT